MALVRGIHRWPMNSPHTWPVTRKMLPLDDVIMLTDFGVSVVGTFNRIYSFLINSSPPRQNGRHFGRRHFQMHFLEWKWYNSDSTFTAICSQEFSWEYANIGSGIGLSRNRRQSQSITWTNADPVHWRICAALGGGGGGGGGRWGVKGALFRIALFLLNGNLQYKR